MKAVWNARLFAGEFVVEAPAFSCASLNEVVLVELTAGGARLQYRVFLISPWNSWSMAR